MAPHRMRARTDRPRWRRPLSLVLDGLAVLAGVLLAFSVESWGQSRDDQARVQRMLAALEAELGVVGLELATRIESDETELAQIDTLFATVILPDGSVEPSAEDVSVMIESIGPRVIEPYQTGALDDLLISGGLTLVGDQQLRQGILEYSRSLRLEESRQENGVDFWNDHLSPYYFRYGDLGQFLVADPLGLQGPPPVTDAFVGAREFANLLGERRAITNRLRAARLGLQAQIDSLTRLLRESPAN